MGLVMCYIMGRVEIQKQRNKYFPPSSKFLWKKHTGWTLMISLSLGIYYIIPGDTSVLEYFAWISTVLTGAVLLSEESAIPKRLYSALTLQVPGQETFHISWKNSHVVGSAWGCALSFCSRTHFEPSMPGYQLFPEINQCWKNPYTHDKVSILCVLVLATESSNVRAGFHTQSTWHSSCHPHWHCCESHSSHALGIENRNPSTVKGSMVSSAEFTDTSA